jgi:hypothetical protein
VNIACNNAPVFRCLWSHVVTGCVTVHAAHEIRVFEMQRLADVEGLWNRRLAEGLEADRQAACIAGHGAESSLKVLPELATFGVFCMSVPAVLCSW